MTAHDAIRLIDGYSFERALEAQSNPHPMIRAAACWRCQPWVYGPWDSFLHSAGLCSEEHLAPDSGRLTNRGEL